MGFTIVPILNLLNMGGGEVGGPREPPRRSTWAAAPGTAWGTPEPAGGWSTPAGTEGWTAEAGP